jgi:hypothetical protein
MKNRIIVYVIKYESSSPNEQMRAAALLADYSYCFHSKADLTLIVRLGYTDSGVPALIMKY